MKPTLPIIVFVLVLRYGAGVSVVAAQEEGRCAPADRFLTEELVMVTRIDPDTLDDWRTGKRLAACRITGSGARRTTIAVAARVFYEKVRAAGWTRTPDPRDSPNEASLRFRLGETDCLFNVYQGILLGTDSEIAVTNAVETRPGDELYHVLVLCVPAMEARPLGLPSSPGRFSVIRGGDLLQYGFEVGAASHWEFRPARAQECRVATRVWTMMQSSAI